MNPYLPKLHPYTTKHPCTMKKPLHLTRNPYILLINPYTKCNIRTSICQKPKHQDETPVHPIVKLQEHPLDFRYPWENVKFLARLWFERVDRLYMSIRIVKQVNWRFWILHKNQLYLFKHFRLRNWHLISKTRSITKRLSISSMTFSSL